MATIVLFVLFLCRKNHRDITLWCVELGGFVHCRENVSPLLYSLFINHKLHFFSFLCFLMLHEGGYCYKCFRALPLLFADVTIPVLRLVIYGLFFHHYVQPWASPASLILWWLLLALYVGSALQGVPPSCMHGHREMVTRRLYLDQSFIPLQRLYCCTFVIFSGWYEAVCASRQQVRPSVPRLAGDFPPRGSRSWSGFRMCTCRSSP